MKEIDKMAYDLYVNATKNDTFINDDLVGKINEFVLLL